MSSVFDRDLTTGVWNRYLKKYADTYLLERDEIGIWSIRLKQKLGFIQPYSILKKQLVAVMTFRSGQHKTFFKKKLVKSRGFEWIITQEGDFELCIVFNENDLKLVETLFKIRKKYKLTETQRKKLAERLKKARAMKNGGV